MPKGGGNLSYVVLTHGGASSKAAHRDGTDRAARRAMDVLLDGGTPLDAAVEACVMLEDDDRFNAGTGSNLRMDGKTIEMDAACMTSAGRFGAVACIRNVKNPVLVAKAILSTPHNLVAGEGATRYARCLGFQHHDPWTKRAQEKFDLLREALRASKYEPSDCEWDLQDLARHWNYEVPLKQVVGPDDTVGCVVGNGREYAAALSTGGTMSTLLGRVGDVPLPGCGLHAGPLGAVAVTGDGDWLTRQHLASRVYRELQAGRTPEEARDLAFTLFPHHVDVGVILVSGNRHAGGSNREMAWSWLVEDAA